jgi:hypothetical protein
MWSSFPPYRETLLCRTASGQRSDTVTVSNSGTFRNGHLIPALGLDLPRVRDHDAPTRRFPVAALTKRSAQCKQNQPTSAADSIFCTSWQAVSAPIYKDADGLWTGWYIGIFGFVLPPDRFAKDLKQPTGWDDLLAPAWKGHLTLSDPVKTGGGYIFIATQIFRFAAAAMTAGQATPPTAEQ